MIDLSTVLAVVAVILLVAGLLTFLAGELLVSGVCFLGLSFAIYVRETRA